MWSKRILLLSVSWLIFMLSQRNSPLNPGVGKLVTITYNVDDLISKKHGIDELAKIIMTSVNPDSWSTDGASSLQVIDDTKLEIHTTATQHGQIKDLLTALRHLKGVGIIVNIRLYEADRSFFEKEIFSKLKVSSQKDARFLPSPIDALLAKRIRMRTTNLQSLLKKTANGEQVTLFSRRRAFTYVSLSNKGHRPELIFDVGFEGEVIDALMIVTADRRKVQMKISEHITRLMGIEKQLVIDPNSGKEAKIDSPTLLKTIISTPIQVRDRQLILVPLQYLPKTKDMKAKDRFWFITLEPKITVEGER